MPCSQATFSGGDEAWTESHLLIMQDGQQPGKAINPGNTFTGAFLVLGHPESSTALQGG